MAVLIFIETLIGLLMTVWWMNVIFSHIPQNYPLIHKTDAPISCYLTTNGVHTDFVFSKNDLPKKMQTEFKQLYQLSDSTLTHVAFGWGEGGFFLKTKKWEDLTISTLLVATFHLGNPAMHVVAEKEPIIKKGQTVYLKLTENEFSLLTAYIQESFEIEKGHFVSIAPHNYGENHLFFEANQSYGLFNTCNTWTNNALKHTGLPTSIWTLFPDGIMRWYE